MSILKVCGIALIAAFAVGILKITRSEFVAPVVAVSSVIILGAAISLISPVKEYLDELSSLSGFSVYFGAIMKALGIGVIADITASLCRDGGHKTLAQNVEFFAKILILLLALPIITEICGAAIEVVK